MSDDVEGLKDVLTTVRMPFNKKVKVSMAIDRIGQLQAENEILKHGLKGDYDLDAWLEWAGEAKSLRSENEALRRELIDIRDMPEYDQDDSHRLRNKAKQALAHKEE